MRDLLKLDIIIGDNGFLKLNPLPVNGMQAEIRLSSTSEQLQTLSLLVPEIKSILFKFDELFNRFLSGNVTTYIMVQEVLKRLDTPNIEGAQINEDFLLDLTEELHERLGRIEALIPEGILTPIIKPNFKDIFNPNNNSFQVCIDLLEDLEITINGLNRLKSGKVGALSATIVATKETIYFFKQTFTDKELLKYFNTHLNTDSKYINKRTKEFKASYHEAKAFIKTNFKK